MYLCDPNQGEYGVELLLGQLARRGAIGQGPDLAQSLAGEPRRHQDGVELRRVDACGCHGEVQHLLEHLCMTHQAHKRMSNILHTATISKMP